MKLSLALLLSVLLAMSPLACGSGSTTGRPVALRGELVADREIDRPFTTDTGWTVRLTRAAISLGALYYFDGEPAFVQRTRGPWPVRLARWLGPGVARAHPGHYVEGDALGQMTEPAALELSSDGRELPQGMGVTGLYRSGRVVLTAPDADAPDLLAGDVALLEGSASKADQTVHFRLSASLADVSRSARDGAISGCVFAEAEVERDGTVTLSVKPSVWLSLVDFSDVAPGSADHPTEIAPGATAQIAFALGVAQLSAYVFSYDADAP